MSNPAGRNPKLSRNLNLSNEKLIIFSKFCGMASILYVCLPASARIWCASYPFKLWITVQMPDLITSPNDYVVGANGCQRSNILAVVPTIYTAYETVAAGNATTYTMLPYSYTSLVDRDSVGVKVDPTVLFQQGQLRVVLTDHQFSAIAIGGAAGQIADGEHWQASVLFVHRSS